MMAENVPKKIRVMEISRDSERGTNMRKGYKV
jgi:hypothetical protein